MDPVDRRKGYSWPETILSDIRILPERGRYSLNDSVRLILGFRVIGGLRVSFNPDVWTVAWEDNDKLVRLAMETSVRVIRAGVLGEEVAGTRKEVRKGKFYWSRDPDLPYRIWTAIIPEDGGGPIIPVSVEDAKAKMFDVAKQYEIPADSFGPGTHLLQGKVRVSWGRRTFIEKGSARGTSKRVNLMIE